MGDLIHIHDRNRKWSKRSNEDLVLIHDFMVSRKKKIPHRLQVEVYRRYVIIRQRRSEARLRHVLAAFEKQKPPQ